MSRISIVVSIVIALSAFALLHAVVYARIAGGPPALRVKYALKIGPFRLSHR